MHVAPNHSYGHAIEIPPIPVANDVRMPATTIADRPRSEISVRRNKTYAPAQTIFFDGDKAESVFEIVTGTVCCCTLTENGRRQIYRFASTGEMLALRPKAPESGVLSSHTLRPSCPERRSR
ncbi:MAG: cyclic nucleotide-binding domain-containing protein [Limibaculum sp.]